MGLSSGQRIAGSVVIGLLFFTAFMNEVYSLQITDLHMPEAVRNGSMVPVVLDCAYTLHNSDDPSELVLKWYFNEVSQPAPVYQWIPSKMPQVSGILKGRLNLDYRASEEPYQVYRAIQIMNPTPDLSGDYTCKVSTFFNESSKTKRLTVYVPERKLELKPIKNLEDEIVNVTCSAEGVFPMPAIAIQIQDRGQELEASTVVQHEKGPSGLYNISASVVLEDQNLESPTTFLCDLTIPETNYTARASAIYRPGANAASKTKIMWILPGFFIFCLLF